MITSHSTSSLLSNVQVLDSSIAQHSATWDTRANISNIHCGGNEITNQRDTISSTVVPLTNATSFNPIETVHSVTQLINSDQTIRCQDWRVLMGQGHTDTKCKTRTSCVP